MSGGLGYLTAVYRDGRVYIGSKSYAAGIFAAHLLNRYYRNDTAARIAVFRQSNWNVQEQLAAGYLSSVDFVNAGEEIQNILLTLPKLKPFDTLDTVSEKQRISEMFTEENAELRQTILSAEEGGTDRRRCKGRSVFFRRNTTRCSSKKVKRCAQQFCEPSAFMMLSRRICARHLNYLNALYLV